MRALAPLLVAIGDDQSGIMSVSDILQVCQYSVLIINSSWKFTVSVMSPGMMNGRMESMWNSTFTTHNGRLRWIKES
jgi:hypothetical protein